MKLFENKFFVLFLILTVSLFSFSAKMAYAGGVVNAVANIVRAVITAVNVVVNTVVGVAEIMIGSIPGLSALYEDGSCRLENTTLGIFTIYKGRCNGVSTSILSTSNSGSCTFSYKITFYNPQFGQTYEYFIDPSQGNTCQKRLVDETQKQVAIYRFVLPADVSQATLTDWFINQIKWNVGKGFVDYGHNQQRHSIGVFDIFSNYWFDYWGYGNDVQPLVVMPYKDLCVGNICELTDATIPQNSYVAYVAKILADYAVPEGSWWYSGTTEGATCPVSLPNKFFNTNNDPSVYFPTTPQMLGNAIIGPIKTGGANCPIPPSSTSTSTSPPASSSTPPIFSLPSSTPPIFSLPSSTPPISSTTPPGRRREVPPQ